MPSVWDAIWKENKSGKVQQVGNGQHGIWGVEGWEGHQSSPVHFQPQYNPSSGWLEQLTRRSESIQKPLKRYKYLGVVVQWLDYLAVTQEPGFRFPTTEKVASHVAPP